MLKDRNAIYKIKMLVNDRQHLCPLTNNLFKLSSNCLTSVKLSTTRVKLNTSRVEIYNIINLLLIPVGDFYHC